MRSIQIEFGKYLVVEYDSMEDPMSAYAGISTEYMEFNWVRIIDFINNTITTPTLEEVKKLEKEYNKCSFTCKSERLLFWEIKKRLSNKWRN